MASQTCWAGDPKSFGQNVHHCRTRVYLVYGHQQDVHHCLTRRRPGIWTAHSKNCCGAPCCERAPIFRAYNATRQNSILTLQRSSARVLYTSRLNVHSWHMVKSSMLCPKTATKLSLRSCKDGDSTSHRVGDPSVTNMRLHVIPRRLSLGCALLPSTSFQKQ